jgi:hypothetical protein
VDAVSGAGDSAGGPRELPVPSKLTRLGEEGEEEAVEMFVKVMLQPADAVS